MKIDTITDNHMHIDPVNGVDIEASKSFERAGGTCLFLVNKMSKDYGISIRSGGDFQKVFERNISLKERIAKETRLQVFAVIGVHPAEFVFLYREFGVEKALEISREGIEIAGRMILEGRATAIGEVGRPHFDVEADVLAASNQLLAHAMTVARDVDCAIQIHAEASSDALFMDLSGMAKTAGLKVEKVVKHFCGPHSDMAEKYGLMPSILASKENVIGSIKNPRFMMESDYIDDNRRPGAVLGPKTVPRLTKKLANEGVLTIENAARIHKDNVEATYGVELN